MSRSNTIFDLDWYDQVHAKKLKELYPNVSSVHVIIRRVLGKIEVREFDLAPEDADHLSISCLNPDCTSKFVLTDILEDSLRKKVVKKGVLTCKGRETNKPGAYSCSCMLEYHIKPKNY